MSVTRCNVDIVHDVDVACKSDCDLPEWLKDSEMFKTMAESGTELMRDAFCSSNCSCYVRENADISCISDFCEVMRCIDYWGVYFWPDSVYNFVVDNVNTVEKWRDESACAAAQHVDFSKGLFDVLFKDVMFKQRFDKKRPDMMLTLCAAGSIRWLQYIYSSSGVDWQYMYTNKACAIAAANGHLECLQFIHLQGCPWNNCTSQCPRGDMSCHWAALGGHLNCLEFLHTKGYWWDENTCSSAAGGGHLNCLKFAHSNGCPWDATTVTNAWERGQLECLKYAVENRCPLDTGKTYTKNYKNWSRFYTTHSRQLFLCEKYDNADIEDSLPSYCPKSAYGCRNNKSCVHLECFRYLYEVGKVDCGFDRWLELCRSESSCLYHRIICAYRED